MKYVSHETSFIGYVSVLYWLLTQISPRVNKYKSYLNYMLQHLAAEMQIFRRRILVFG